MLPVDNGMITGTDIDDIAQRAEEARQIARFCIRKQQETDARKYNLRQRSVEYRPGDLVWVWMPIHRRGLSEKLRRYFRPYKVICRLSDANYEAVSPTRRPCAEVVHVVWLKPYHSPSFDTPG